MINEKEIIRYLGYGRNKPDSDTMSLIRKCYAELEKAARPIHTYRRMKAGIAADRIKTEAFEIYSSNLAKNLMGCEEIILFAATLGIQTDMLMNRNVRLAISNAAVLQACGAAMIEDYCNECQRDIEKKLALEKLYVRPRFSPGYGDFDLEYQQSILDALDARKSVGIYLSDGNIMIPEKTVTAVIGISENNTKCHIEGCEACNKINCLFRRDS